MSRSVIHLCVLATRVAARRWLSDARIKPELSFLPDLDTVGMVTDMAAHSAPVALQKAIVAPLERLRGLPPIQAILTATDVNQVLLDAQAEVASIRRQAIRNLRASGWTLAEIGDQLGMSPQRVHQLEIGYDRRDKK